jgi:hypothetical protein
MRKTVIHVNQHVIKSNKKSGKKEAPLTAKTYLENRKGSHVRLINENGEEVGRFVYSPDKPLACGAHVWFETNKLNVEVQ